PSDMTIRFRCPNGHTLQVGEDMAGQSGECPKCQVAVRVPALEAQASESPAPQATPVARPVAKPVAKPIAKPVATPIAKPAGMETGEAAPATERSSPPVIDPPVVDPSAIAPPASPTPSVHWYLRIATGEQFGPATDEQFRQWIADRRVTDESYVWRDGWTDWRPASQAVDDLPAPLVAPAPTVAPTVDASTSAATSAAARYRERRQRSTRLRVIAAVLLLILTLILAGVLAWVLMPPAEVSVHKAAKPSAESQRLAACKFAFSQGEQKTGNLG
ncbi:MAG: GYF domain-containing protein, partial [Planctomycetota bacterium]